MPFFVFTVYLHHETTQCFVKQSRDFVVLAAERVEVSLQWCLTLGWGGVGVEYSQYIQYSKAHSNHVLVSNVFSHL